MKMISFLKGGINNMENEKFYAGYGLNQFQENYPNLNQTAILLLAENLEKCCCLDLQNGDILEVTFKDGKVAIGIMRNLGWNLGYPLEMDFEKRDINFTHKNRFHRDESKIIKIPIIDILDIKFIKKGNEQLSKSEQQQALDWLHEGISQEEVELRLS